MQQRYRLFLRRGSVYYFVDNLTGRQESLGTKDRKDAERLVHAKNEAHRQPLLNLRIARAYLAAGDPSMVTRTWQEVMEEIMRTKEGETKSRWLRASKDHAFDSIRSVKVFETRADHFLKVLAEGRVATNVFLRRLHNFALDTNWLLAPVLLKRQWPRPRYQEKRAITLQEHRRIVELEQNPERRAFYELAWHLGAAQSDLAHLQAEDVDWENKVISFARLKLRWRGQQPCQFFFGDEVQTLLQSLPKTGPLFPKLRPMQASHRATEFQRACRRAMISGVTLHSFRCAWAERAKQAGYPERFAMEALGHNSQAIHRAYSRKAKLRLPALEEYEKTLAQTKIIPMPLPKHEAPAKSQ